MVKADPDSVNKLLKTKYEEEKEKDIDPSKPAEVI